MTIMRPHECGEMTQSTDSSIPLSEREWEKLINSTIAGGVIPVVGQELLVAADDPNGTSLYDIWGQVLAEQASLDIPRQDGTPMLYQVTNQLLQAENRSELAMDIDDVIRHRKWPIPDTLLKLSSITNFSLFVTTTIDHLLCNALEETRPAYKGKMRKIEFAVHGDKSHNDLPVDFEASMVPTTFHIFGSTSPFPDSFAKTEDDLIDFSASMLDSQYAPERFYDFLQNKTILLLGCSFPDWLGRFFIRALNANRVDQTINIYYLSGRKETGLENFLRRKKAKILSPVSPSRFVEGFYRRWQSRKAASEQQTDEIVEANYQPASLKPGAVFLSYAGEDKETVRRVRDQLEASNVDTWMDESGLEPGEHFADTIRENIRQASCFIAFVSKSLATRERRFLWREWKWAEDASLDRPKAQRYLQVVVIDDTPRGAKFVDPPFSGLHWARTVQGTLPEEFVQQLSQGVRAYRRSK